MFSNVGIAGTYLDNQGKIVLANQNRKRAQSTHMYPNENDSGYSRQDVKDILIKALEHNVDLLLRHPCQGMSSAEAVGVGSPK